MADGQLHVGEVLDKITVRLNGLEYMLLDLAREEELLRKMGARRWRVPRKSQAQTRRPPANVRPGEIDGEWVLTLDDWSKGVASESDETPGTLYKTHHCSGIFPGTLRSNPGERVPALAPATQIDPLSDTAMLIVFNGFLFFMSGRYVIRFVPDQTVVTDKDFGAGNLVSDAVVHNNALLVGFQGTATKKIESRNTSGVWTAATDNVYISHFAIVSNRLWVNQSNLSTTNQVSNIGPTDNPLALANYSAGITVGEVTSGITDLNAYGQQLLVSKPEGMFLGDAAAEFPNVIPSMAAIADPDNGKNTLVRGADAFYPHRNGLIMWSERQGPNEIGLQQVVRAGAIGASIEVPGVRIRALAAEGQYVWAVAEPSGQPGIDVRGFHVTTNNGVSYANYTTITTDNNYTSGATLDALGTVVDGDWFVVGNAATFRGIEFELSSPNTNNSVMTVEYWNGTAWTAPALAPLDLTVTPTLASPSSRGTASLSRSGRVLFRNDFTGWSSSTINGILAFYVRISFSAALSATVRVAEARALVVGTSLVTALPSWVYRGRPVRPDDLRNEPIIWEPYEVGPIPQPMAALVFDRRMYPFNQAGALAIGGFHEVDLFPLPLSASAVSKFQTPEDNDVMAAYTPFYDFGMPLVQKKPVAIKMRGRGINTATSVVVAAATDLGGVYTTLLSSDGIGSVDTASLTNQIAPFYRIQLRITFGDDQVDVPAVLETLELTVRELPTYKNEYEMVFLVADGLTNSKGGSLLSARKQLANLEALAGSTNSNAGFTFIDPIGQSKTVQVFEMEELEVYQLGANMAGLAVRVRCAEE